MSHFGALWRRSPVFKGVLVLATGLSLLLVAALSLQPSGKPPGAALPPSVAQSRFTAPASQTVAIGQRPVAAAASAAGSGGQVIAPSRPNASIAPRADTDPAATLMGKTVTGDVAAQGKSVPLPPGQWIVVAYFPAPDPGGVESLFLDQVRRDKLSRAVLVQASTQVGASATGFRQSAQCARTALLYVKTITNEEFGRQDCWTINHNLSTPSAERDTPPIIRAAIGDLELRGVKYPPVLLSAFFRLADKQSFLHAVYYFNPETDGITSKPAIWEESDWNRNYIYQYPEKIAYVEKLRAWAEAWHPAVRDGFQGADLALPGLPEAARKP